MGVISADYRGPLNAEHRGLLTYFAALHESTVYEGFRRFHRSRHDVPNASTIFRWRQWFGDELLCFPNVHTSALGLLDLHLFVEGAASAWLEYPYAIAGERLLITIGRPILYLHCLIPLTHVTWAETLREDLQKRTGANVQEFTTSEGWQYFNGHALNPAMPETPPTEPLGCSPATAIVRTFPLIVPQVLESLEQQYGLPTLAVRMRKRLARSYWRYLPRTFRRRNLTAHAAHAQRLISEHLFRQNVIRFRGALCSKDPGRGERLDTIRLEVFVIARLHDPRIVAQWIDRLRPRTAFLDLYRGTGVCVLRLVGDAGMLDALLHLPGNDTFTLYYTDRTADRVKVRFQYETLFDPATSTWRAPPNDPTT